MTEVPATETSPDVGVLPPAPPRTDQTELRQRHLTLIANAVEALLVLGLAGLFIVGWNLTTVQQYGGVPDDLIAFIAVCLLLGTLIILSAWHKVYFHILSALMVACLAWLLTDLFGADPIAFVVCLLALTPQILYYYHRLKERK